MVACAYGGWASNCRSLGVKLASDVGASVACMQPPSMNPSSPTSNNMSPDLGTTCPPKRYTAPFAARIVQKSRRHGRQACENEVGFADRRARAGGDARLFQSFLRGAFHCAGCRRRCKARLFLPANVDGVVKSSASGLLFFCDCGH